MAAGYSSIDKQPKPKSHCTRYLFYRNFSSLFFFFLWCYKPPPPMYAMPIFFLLSWESIVTTIPEIVDYDIDHQLHIISIFCNGTTYIWCHGMATHVHWANEWVIGDDNVDDGAIKSPCTCTHDRRRVSRHRQTQLNTHTRTTTDAIET